MLRLKPSGPGERSRMRATRALYIRHGAESTPEGQSLRLLRQWLSPAQRAQFAEKGYFEVVGGDTDKQYRIYAGAAMNVCEVDEKGRPKLGLCFVPVGELPPGDVMLSQKIALESCEPRARRGSKIRSEPFLVPERPADRASRIVAAHWLREPYPVRAVRSRPHGPAGCARLRLHQSRYWPRVGLRHGRNKAGSIAAPGFSMLGI